MTSSALLCPTNRRLAALVALAAGVCIQATPQIASAEQMRVALVIGSNLGQPDEIPLLFAERDAERVADVLVRLGGVSENNLLLLRGADSARVQRVIRSITEKIAARRAKSSVEVLLVVYFSGHASVGALHLGQSTLAFPKLRKLVSDVGADVSVFVVDACRSGGLTRVKGATPAAPFEIKIEDALQNKGTVIITSSSAGEDAQESERLAGGIFTHHFINGLRGAADSTSDQRVTVGEAYQYAYGQTLRTTSRTRFVQHPTYAFRIKGKQDLTLTRIDAAAGQGRLHLTNSGFYVIMNKTRGGAVVAELHARAGTDVVLPPGRYLVRRRGARGVHEGQVSVQTGGRAQVAVKTMKRVPYGTTVRRGFAERNLVSIDATTTVAQPAMAGHSTALFGSFGATLETAGARFQLRLRYGQTSATNADLDVVQSMLGTDVGLFRIFDVPRVNLGLGIGVRLGGDWVMQRFTTAGVAPDRDQWVWRASPVLRVEYAPAARWIVGLECGLDVYAMQMQRDRTAQWESPVAAFCAAGLSVYLP